MDWSKREYEVQHFLGFDRQLLKEGARVMINDRIETLAETACRDLTKVLDLNPHKVEILRSKLDKVVNLYKQSAQEPTKKIDEHIDRWFTIPDNVLLPMDEDSVHSEAERSNLTEECRQLREKALSLAVAKRLLKCELTRSEQLLQVLNTYSAEADECLAIQCPSVPVSLTKSYFELFHNTANIKDEYSSLEPK